MAPIAYNGKMDKMKKMPKMSKMPKIVVSLAQRQRLRGGCAACRSVESNGNKR
jgi:hypothetical protein